MSDETPTEERCAQVCDALVEELKELKVSARKNRYDRHSEREIDYAIRIVRRAATRIRHLSPLKPPGESDE